MKFAIISAGVGERMKADGVSVPKPLVRINGQPMIGRLIDLSVENGAKEISCIVNEDSMEVHDYLRSLKLNIPLKVVVKSTPSSLHSFFALKTFLENDYFCMSTVDSIFRNEDFRNFLEYAENNRPAFDALLAITDFVDDDNPLCLSLEPDNRISRFYDGDATCKFVTGGLYYFSPCILNELEEAVNNGMMRLRNFLKFLVEKGYRAYSYYIPRMIDVDHFADVRKAEEFLNG
jgi:NDP-sugar pyrophosphorylase family protein